MEVFLEIHRRGYIVLPKFHTDINGYPVDLVVMDPVSGKKLTVECDGNYYHRGQQDKQARDLGRQNLEQEGWRSFGV